MKVLSTALAIAGSCMASHAFAAPEMTAPAQCDRQVVMQIDSAKISVGPDGFTIDAFGVAESAGWSNPTLVAAGSILNGSTLVDFVACRPGVSAQVLTPVQARETLKLDPATKHIVIRSKTNSMTVDITQSH